MYADLNKCKLFKKRKIICKTWKILLSFTWLWSRQTANGLMGWEKGWDGCPWIYRGRARAKSNFSHFCNTESRHRIGRCWLLISSNTHKSMYWQIKPHCNDICATLWAFHLSASISTLNTQSVYHLGITTISIVFPHTRSLKSHVWSRHFHRQQPPLVDWVFTRAKHWLPVTLYNLDYLLYRGLPFVTTPSIRSQITNELWWVEESFAHFTKAFQWVWVWSSWLVNGNTI